MPITDFCLQMSRGFKNVVEWNWRDGSAVRILAALPGLRFKCPAPKRQLTTVKNSCLKTSDTLTWTSMQAEQHNKIQVKILTSTVAWIFISPDVKSPRVFAFPQLHCAGSYFKKVQMINFLKSIGMILSTQVVIPEACLPSSVVLTTQNYKQSSNKVPFLSLATVSLYRN